MSQNKVQPGQVDITIGLPSVNLPLGTTPTPFTSWILDTATSHAGVTVPLFNGAPGLGGTWNGPGPGSYITGPVFGDLRQEARLATAIGTLGAITPGSGYTAGVYPTVPLTSITGIGSGATANITVAGGAVTSVVLVDPGYDYAIGDILSAASVDIGGPGSGFQIPVATVINPDFIVWGQHTLEMEFTIQASGPTGYLAPSLTLYDLLDNGYIFELGTFPGPTQFSIVVRKAVHGVSSEVAVSASNYTHGGNIKTVKMVDDGTNLRFYVDTVLVETFPTILPYGPSLTRLSRLYISFNNNEKLYGIRILGT